MVDRFPLKIASAVVIGSYSQLAMGLAEKLRYYFIRRLVISPIGQFAASHSADGQFVTGQIDASRE